MKPGTTTFIKKRWPGEVLWLQVVEWHDDHVIAVVDSVTIGPVSPRYGERVRIERNDENVVDRMDVDSRMVDADAPFQKPN